MSRESDSVKGKKISKDGGAKSRVQNILEKIRKQRDSKKASSENGMNNLGFGTQNRSHSLHQEDAETSVDPADQKKVEANRFKSFQRNVKDQLGSGWGVGKIVHNIVEPVQNAVLSWGYNRVPSAFYTQAGPPTHINPYPAHHFQQWFPRSF